MKFNYFNGQLLDKTSMHGPISSHIIFTTTTNLYHIRKFSDTNSVISTKLDVGTTGTYDRHIQKYSIFGVPFTTDCCHWQRSIGLLHLAIFPGEYSLRKIVKCIRSITHDDRLHTGQALHCKKSSENFERKYIFLSNLYYIIAKVGKYFPFLIIKILILKKLQIFTQHFPMIFPVY